MMCQARRGRRLRRPQDKCQLIDFQPPTHRTGHRNVCHSGNGGQLLRQGCRLSQHIGVQIIALATLVFTQGSRQFHLGLEAEAFDVTQLILHACLVKVGPIECPPA